MSPCSVIATARDGSQVLKCKEMSFSDAGVGPGVVLVHGVANDPKLTCNQVLPVPSFNTGEFQPQPWEQDKISDEYLNKATKFVVRGKDPIGRDVRLNRVRAADEETDSLHKTLRDSGSLNFQYVLEGLGGNSKERIVCQLKCKGILNLSALSSLRNDIAGDCTVCLTEDVGAGSRRIYFIQMRSLFCVVSGENSETYGVPWHTSRRLGRNTR